MTAAYLVVHDPHAIPLNGARFTRQQIERAAKRGDLLPGMLFAHRGEHVILMPIGLVKTGKKVSREKGA